MLAKFMMIYSCNAGVSVMIKYIIKKYMITWQKYFNAKFGG